MTRDKRQSQKALLELLVETAEGYEREVECDRELYRLIALDAKGIPDSRITAGWALNLLSEAAKAEADTEPNGKVADTARAKVASRAKAHARPVVVAH